jgi:hypothetical protein
MLNEPTASLNPPEIWVNACALRTKEPATGSWIGAEYFGGFDHVAGVKEVISFASMRVGRSSGLLGLMQGRQATRPRAVYAKVIRPLGEKLWNAHG